MSVPSRAADAGLSVTELSVAAGGTTLLRGVSLHLAAGDVVALSGPSGLGKSRLLRALCGLDTHEAGDVRLDGRPPASWGWPAWRRVVSLVQQRAVMLPGSVADNLRLAFQWQSACGASFDVGTARQLLSDLGLPASLWGDEARRLSLGQAQRVALARALLTSPRVLLLDEPTASLDPASARRVEGAVRRACAAGAAALVVSHDPDQGGRLGAETLDLSPFRAEGHDAA